MSEPPISTNINDIVDATWLSRPSPTIALELLGCTLVRQLPSGEQIRGVIVETEAYMAGDPACHAYRKRTPRNTVMFGLAGMSYVYIIYGIYHCLNVVTDVDGVASAVLIRALELPSVPNYLQQDLNILTESNRNIKKPLKKDKLSRLAAGPGKLCRVLQIDRTLTDLPLQPDQPLWLEHRTPAFQESMNSGKTQVVQTTRIGISQGTDIPWRWYIADCEAVSKR
ncbi:MAG: DNA-3-methyladenine glycosylase [Cyanobacteriota bacterium]|nr:DNA-3-methyladenine glycosylase [Cyanobacteriota bacterium]